MSFYHQSKTKCCTAVWELSDNSKLSDNYYLLPQQHKLLHGQNFAAV